MAHSLAKNYLHIIFSTKYRLPLIDEYIELELHHYLGDICHRLECYPIKIGGYWDHVHILCLLSKKIALMKLLEDLKSESSGWIKDINNRYANFYWQGGYGAFSVSPHALTKVEAYIENQHEHHKSQSFQDEYREILKREQVQFDERDLWW